MTLEELLNILILVYLDRAVISVLNFHAEEFPCNSQILHLKSFTETVLDCEDVFVTG